MQGTFILVCTYQADNEVSSQSVSSERPVQTDKDKADVKLPEIYFDRCFAWKKTSKTNALLKESPLSLSVVLYQDSFEVHQSKRSIKKMSVYLTLGEILSYNCSCNDPMQSVLSLLGERRSFGEEQNFSPLVANLKDIEELGLETEDSSSLK